jgi:hypothetical protein
MENWIGDLKLSVLKLYSGVAEDCFFLDMTLHHKVIRSASHFEGKYCLYFQEPMLEEFFGGIYYLVTQGQIPEERNRQTHFFVVHRFPEEAFK